MKKQVVEDAEGRLRVTARSDFNLSSFGEPLAVILSM